MFDGGYRVSFQLSIVSEACFVLKHPVSSDNKVNLGKFMNFSTFRFSIILLK